MERNFVSKEEKEKFSKRSVHGLAAPETANNAACSGSFVPLLTLGIPGSGTTAVMLGALLGFWNTTGSPDYIYDKPRNFLVCHHVYVYWYGCTFNIKFTT